MLSNGYYYGLETRHLEKSDFRSLDFAVNRIFNEALQSEQHRNCYRQCQQFSNFEMPSHTVTKRTVKFEPLFYFYVSYSNPLCAIVKSVCFFLFFQSVRPILKLCLRFLCTSVCSFCLPVGREINIVNTERARRSLCQVKSRFVFNNKPPF